MIVDDAERWRFHRLIENFAYRFLFGQSRLAVTHAIQLERAEREERVWEIMDRVHCCIVGDFDTHRPVYSIDVGTGESYTQGYDEDGGAQDPNYESLLVSGNTNENDHDLAETLIRMILQRFPELDIQNKIYVTGSFHEQFQHWSVIVFVDSVIRVAEARKQTPEQIIADIFDIIRSGITKARAEKL